MVVFGQLHRLDGPAVKYNYKASQKYEKEAVKNIFSGLETNNGFIWYQNGKRHREKGPAFVQLDGTELWYYNDVLHREKGPALIKPNGQKEWWLFGDWIKTEGPAISYADTGAIG